MKKGKNQVSKRYSVENNNEKKKQGGNVVTPNVRPVRERKAVDRYSMSPNSHSSGSKSLSIAKSSGTPLKHIPNEIEEMKINVVTPNARPVRERKAVERYSMSSPDSHSSGSKPLSIAEGSGTPLKVILNASTMDVPAKPESKLNENSEKYSVGNNNEKEKEGGNVVTPNGRPVRERKAVDRYSMFLDSCSSGSKLPSIAKGSGTPLKDIPNASAMDIPAKPESKLNENSERYSGNNSEKDKEGGDVVTPNGRPVRERKAVDRYTISTSHSHSSGSKPLSIAKGSGTPLKDIPNVAFKLSKRKPDDTLQLLHMILFGKRAKVHTLKKDIGLFSGFVWEANEEKQRAKTKEKLDKCVKDKLLDFCDVLNIPVHKLTVKKEELLTKLLEFLESPHATTEVLLADIEQKSKKQKRSATSSRSRSSKKAAGENSSEKTQSGEKRKRLATIEGNETDDIDDKPNSQSHSPGEEDDVLQKQGSDREQISSDEKSEVKDKKTSPKSLSEDNSKEKSGTKSPATSAKKTKDTPNNSKSAKKTKDTPKNSRSAKKTTDTSEKSSSVIEPSDLSLKAARPASEKRQKIDEETKHKISISAGKSLSKKPTSKSAKSVGGEEETIEEDKAEPTREELRAVAVNILKEVDFDTATLSDILRLLGSHFGVDLNHRKSEVKAIVEEVIESMSVGDSDEDEDADNGENGGDNDEVN